MAAWIERLAAPDGGALVLVYLELVPAFVLLSTVLHFRRFRATEREARAVRSYFLSFFGLVLAAPVLIIALTSGRPQATLVAAGWTFGRAGLGVPLTLAGLPIAVLAGLFGARDPAIQRMYPLAKAACARPGAFAVYELSYFGFYYVPWEFAFRGVLFLPLVPAIGLVPALAIQTAVSTLLHAGHPLSEIAAAAGAGVVLGLIAYGTGSFFYPLVLHASAGMAADSFLFARRRKAGL